MIAFTWNAVDATTAALCPFTKMVDPARPEPNTERNSPGAKVGVKLAALTIVLTLPVSGPIDHADPERDTTYAAGPEPERNVRAPPGARSVKVRLKVEGLAASIS